MLEWNDTFVDWQVDRFRATLEDRQRAVRGIVDRTVECVAIDGPLRRGLDVIGRYRVAEKLLTRRLQPLIGKPGQSSSPVGRLLNENANLCALEALSTGCVRPAAHSVAIDEFAIVEAFPSSFLGVLLAKPQEVRARRGDRSDTFFEMLADTALTALLNELLPSRELRRPFSAATNHDDRAAIVCAMTALCVAEGRYSAVGDDDGWIILPPRPFLQPWASDLIEANGRDSDARPPLFVQ
ncbi:hypothetical protein [Brevundimonas sp.]|uniref:hypothetical protein n=1 Tax=Brevundimonas sp. TaxID=1871086 RepID=UPI0025D3F2EB|nr:hypothetical protein [Brevundimonas sp.]